MYLDLGKAKSTTIKIFEKERLVKTKRYIQINQQMG